MRYYVYTMSLLCIALTGCAGGPSFSIQTMMNNQVYMRDCVGPNSKHRPGDDECIYRNEPVPQPFSVQRVEKPDPNDIQWKIYCRRESSKSDPDCQRIGLVNKP